MAGVKKTGGSARKASAAPGRRNKAAKVATRKPAKTPGRKAAKAPSRKAAKAPSRKAAKAPSRKAAKAPSRKGARTPTRKAAKTPTRKAAQPSATPRSIIRIRDLDPYKKCGAGTSVERLVRVDEMVDRRLEAHLVFLDRHGWYCEHGRGCHAVGHARKHRE